MPRYQVTLIAPGAPIYGATVVTGTQEAALRKALQQNNISLVITELKEGN